MYQLTLTADERRAIDLIGDRYEHGCELFRLLWCKSRARPNNVDWRSDTDITFKVPENIAWEIGQVGERCSLRWDCFALELANKLTEFCVNIV